MGLGHVWREIKYVQLFQALTVRNEGVCEVECSNEASEGVIRGTSLNPSLNWCQLHLCQSFSLQPCIDLLQLLRAGTETDRHLHCQTLISKESAFKISLNVCAISLKTSANHSHTDAV